MCSTLSEDCATSKLRNTSRRGPSIHFVSSPITVYHHLQRIDILPEFQLQCPIASAMRYLQIRFALCMSRAEGLCTPLAHSLNVWAFCGDGHQCAHNRSVQAVFTRTKQMFLIRNSRFPIAHQDRIAIVQTSTRQQTVEELCKGLDEKSSFGPDQQTPEECCFDPSCGQLTRFQLENFAHGSHGSVPSFMETNQHPVVHWFAHHDTVRLN